MIIVQHNVSGGEDVGEVSVDMNLEGQDERQACNKHINLPHSYTPPCYATDKSTPEDATPAIPRSVEPCQ